MTAKRTAPADPTAHMTDREREAFHACINRALDAREAAGLPRHAPDPDTALRVAQILARRPR